jgi:hypothetical protein
MSKNISPVRQTCAGDTLVKLYNDVGLFHNMYLWYANLEFLDFCLEVTKVFRTNIVPTCFPIIYRVCSDVSPRIFSSR